MKIVVLHTNFKALLGLSLKMNYCHRLIPSYFKLQGETLLCQFQQNVLNLFQTLSHSITYTHYTHYLSLSPLPFFTTLLNLCFSTLTKTSRTQFWGQLCLQRRVKDFNLMSTSQVLTKLCENFFLDFKKLILMLNLLFEVSNERVQWIQQN